MATENAKNKTMKVRIMFTEPSLGTLPSVKDLADRFIASKAPKEEMMEEELAALPDDQRPGLTVFARNDAGQPCYWDYQIKGFCKDACGMMARIKGSHSSKVKAYKKVIDGLIFPAPRMIAINVNGEIGSCQRPLRAQTAQGERISIASSEEVPAGSWFDLDIVLLDDAYVPLVEEWLDYGALRGLSQWRNSGKGRFIWCYREATEEM